MNQKAKKKFQVIGACARTQTLSLEEEFRLIEGVPYELDIFQNFSGLYLNGNAIQDISTSDLCKLLEGTENTVMADSVNTRRFEAEDYQLHLRVQEAMDREIRASRKERRWEKKKDKISGKKAAKKLDEVLRDFFGGELE